MLRTLDPHSVFFDPDQFEQLQQMQQSESKGFGTVVSLLPGRVIVLQTLEGSPSAKAGLSAGDEILAINTIPVRYLDIRSAGATTCAKPASSEAMLDVRKPGASALVQVTMSPELLDAPSVDRAYMVAPGIGHLRITSFEEPTGKLVQETIEKLGGENLKGLILDLRDNPGGAVQAAAETAVAISLARSAHLQHRRPQRQNRSRSPFPRLRSPTRFPSRS